MVNLLALYMLNSTGPGLEEGVAKKKKVDKKVNEIQVSSFVTQIEVLCLLNISMCTSNSFNWLKLHSTPLTDVVLLKSFRCGALQKLETFTSEVEIPPSHSIAMINFNLQSNL